MKSLFSNPKLTLGQEIGELLWDAGARLAFEATDAAKRVTTRKRKAGATLRPGEATPLWNALAIELRAELKQYGHQARLARVMGVSRQTINAWLTSKTTMPDAERTLQLVAWLLAKRSGHEPL